METGEAAGLLQSLLCRLPDPVYPPIKIPLNSTAADMKAAQHVLRPGVTLLCRLAVPGGCLCAISSDAPAALPAFPAAAVHFPEVELGFGMTLPGRFAVPSQGFGVISFYVLACCMHDPQTELGLGFPLRGCPSEPFQSLAAILPDAHAKQIHSAEIVLRGGVTLHGCLAVPLRSLAVVLLGPPVLVVQITEHLLSRGVALFRHRPDCCSSRSEVTTSGRLNATFKDIADILAQHLAQPAHHQPAVDVGVEAARFVQASAARKTRSQPRAAAAQDRWPGRSATAPIATPRHASSTIVQAGVILSPQWRHLPRSTMKDTIGTRSRMASATLQVSHRDRSETQFSPRGIRQAAQLVKLPKTGANAIRMASGRPAGTASNALIT